MLSALHRRCAYAVLILLFGSGLAHWLLHGWFMRVGEFGPTPDPLEPWMLKLHGAAAMAGLVLLGSVAGGHVNRFWRLARNRLAGGVFLGCALLLVASGVDFITAFSAVVSMLNNGAHGLGAVGPAHDFAAFDDFQTWVCTFAMLAGRLELFMILVPLTPAFWRE